MSLRLRFPQVYVAAVIGWIIALQLIYFQRGLVPGDAFVYLAAGERLNAGHPLYALSEGDRAADINPEYWRIPLVSPPLIAVVWRPLALLGYMAPYAWWAAQVVALVSATVLLLAQRPVLGATALLALSVPFVYEFAVGNVNSFILLGLVLGWQRYVRKGATALGAVGALGAAIKVTPAAVVWWALVVGHRRARFVALGTAAAALLVSFVGAGLANHVAYVEALAAGDVRFSPLSLGGMLRFVGVPDPAVRITVAAVVCTALILIWRLRDRPDRGFQVAVVAMIAASPAVSINWFVLLLALLAPLAWPLPERALNGDRTG